MSLLDTASLIVTPNGYKEGKLYSVIPSDGSGDLSVTRATTATRVNSAGLVELVPYNLFTYSEQFDNADWAKDNSTITSNSIVAPNGTTTADKINEDNVNALHQIRNLYSGIGAHTFSVYAKKAERNYVCLYTGGGTLGAYFDINNGAVVSTFGSGVTASIESVGNGWYRCSFNFTGSGLAYGTIAISNNGSSVSYTGTTGSGIYIWGAQLNEGTIKPYQKTETRLNIPRLDYSNGTCPSLLVEPQRTNLFTYSEDYTNSNWTKENATISANSTTAPSGITTADLITSTSSSFSDILQGTSQSSGNTYTLSCYAKKGSSDWIFLRLTFAAAAPRVWFNVNTGTIGTIQSGLTATIESVGNGWYRCSVTGVASATPPADRIDIALANADASTSPSVGNSVYVWGAQLELGSYATSYIPTTSASVTRNADVISKTGISSLIGQTEGTLFIDTYIDNIAAQTNDPVLFYVKGSVAEAYIEINDTGGVYGVFYDGSTSQGFIFANIGLTNGRHKMAFGYKNNDFVLYVDGVQVGTDTSGTVSGSLTEFGLQYYDNFYRGAQEVNASALWKTRLTNTQLAQLTTI